MSTIRMQQMDGVAAQGTRGNGSVQLSVMQRSSSSKIRESKTETKGKEI